MKYKLIKLIIACSTCLFMAMTPGGLESMSTELESLEKADTKKVLTKDIQMTRTYIAEAKSAEGATKKRYLKRVELAMELVRALVTASQISDAADAQETAAYSAPQTLKKLQEKVDALTKRRNELKKTIQQLEK